MVNTGGGIQRIFPGRACEVTFRPTILDGTAILTNKNTANAVEGSKIRITTGGKHYYLSVSIVPSQSDAARDNIQVKGPNGTSAGQFEVISGFQYKLYKALEVQKARYSLIATTLSVLSAAGAAINSAQHSSSVVVPCTGLRCVTPVSWVLIGISAASAIFSWWKDNIASS
jgi:hypothetical protein